MFERMQETRSFRLKPAHSYAFAGASDGEVRLVQAAENRRPPRELRTLIVAGSAYRKFRQGWRSRVKQIADAASAHFEAEFGIRLVVDEIRPWKFLRAPRTADRAMEQLHREVDPGNHDLVIALTLFAFPGAQRGAEVRGFSQYFSQYVLVPDQWMVSGAVTRLVHELGHVFGAFHDREPGSIMLPVFRRLPSNIIFSRPMREVIGLTRDVDLRRGVESLDDRVARRIQRLYETYHHPREPSDRDPITVGYRYQAMRAEWSGDDQRAAAMRQRAEQLKPGGKSLPEVKSRPRETSPSE